MAPRFLRIFVCSFGLKAECRLVISRSLDPAGNRSDEIMRPSRQAGSRVGGSTIFAMALVQALGGQCLLRDPDTSLEKVLDRCA